MRRFAGLGRTAAPEASVEANSKPGLALHEDRLRERMAVRVLEAMVAGVPVVTSDRGAMREVAGGAALLVDPESVDSIADGIRRVVQDAGVRRELVERGRVRAGEFSWDRTAKETLAVLRTAAGRTP